MPHISETSSQIFLGDALSSINAWRNAHDPSATALARLSRARHVSAPVGVPSGGYEAASWMDSGAVTFWKWTPATLTWKVIGTSSYPILPARFQAGPTTSIVGKTLPGMTSRAESSRWGGRQGLIAGSASALPGSPLVRHGPYARPDRPSSLLQARSPDRSRHHRCARRTASGPRAKRSLRNPSGRLRTTSRQSSKLQATRSLGFKPALAPSESHGDRTARQREAVFSNVSAVQGHNSAGWKPLGSNV